MDALMFLLPLLEACGGDEAFVEGVPAGRGGSARRNGGHGRRGHGRG